MMYLSYANDYESYSKEGAKHIIAVVLDDEFYHNLKSIQDISQRTTFPYRVDYTFRFPTDKVRLLESEFLDEYITDTKEYASWELGGDHPLDYYHHEVHSYEPKENFWYAIKPDVVMLTHSGGNSFGFNARFQNKMYYGYGFDWSRYIK